MYFVLLCSKMWKAEMKNGGELLTVDSGNWREDNFHFVAGDSRYDGGEEQEE